MINVFGPLYPKWKSCRNFRLIPLLQFPVLDNVNVDYKGLKSTF